MRSFSLIFGLLTRSCAGILIALRHHSYQLCILPHWNPSAAIIERFEAPLPAMMRHAQLARDLREAGWMVIDHVAAACAQAVA